jgi:hypothetical protein
MSWAGFRSAPAMVAATLVLDVLGGLLVPLPVFPNWLG